ncbi:E3 ubiquitin-protein ligase TRIM45-like isoform X2 [Porites lutea]|uniref:E3 ubiquitin-protein ligase TRIM45-like isoform X2 n=1 Tax=Porites lutea TaxID=51062 RepID=UPI003CC6BAF6
MDLTTLFYNLREEVSCSVCSDLFTEPKHLSCLHSFCLKCVKRWYETCGGGQAIKCPKCQTLSRVPASGDLKDLPTSFYLNGLIDVLAIKEWKKTQFTCGNCDKKSSEASYCFQCCIFYCEQCLVAHNMMRDKKEHRVLAVKEFQDKDYEDVLKRPVFCSKERHQKEELKYYCKECETALCQTCVTLNHGGHNLRLIEEEAENKTLEIKSILQSQREGLDAKLNVIVQLDEDCAKVIQQSEIARRDVQRFADGLIKTIQAKMKNVITAVENQTKKSLESLKAKRSAIQQQINSTESSLEEADKLLKRSTNAEVVELKKSLQTVFQGLNQTEPIVYDPSSLQTLVFVENQKTIDTVNGEELGFLCMEEGYRKKPSEFFAEGKGLKEGTVGRKAQFNLITRNAEKNQGHNKHDRVEIKDKQAQECVTQVRIDDNEDGTHKITYYPRVQGTFKLLVKEGSGDGMLKYPCGVSVSDGDEIMVTDNQNHRIQVFDRNGTFLRSFGHKGKNAGEFICPIGIAINKDRNILVADNNNHRVQILSWEGRHLGSFGGKGSLDSQLLNPWGLSLDSTGNVIVADIGNKLIKIFTPEGRFVMKIGGQGSFSYPLHCVQCGEYFIVSDSNEHCIKVFNREGDFQYKFGKKGEGDGDFNCPRFLSVTQSKHLLVCDEGSHRIQVFELDGKFVGKFGTNGSKLGEFNYPFSVAVLNNEQIVVSERSNHRIQIFQ